MTGLGSSLVVVVALCLVYAPCSTSPSRARINNSKRLLIEEAPRMEAYSAKPDRRGHLTPTLAILKDSLTRFSLLVFLQK